jgi:transposase InsO family protein
MYEVVLVYYDEHFKEAAVYRHALDDLPPHPYDRRPWSAQIIREMVDRYHLLHPNSRNDLTPVVKWPSTEAEMLIIQRGDPLLQPIVSCLEEKDDWWNWMFQVSKKRGMYIARGKEGKKAALRVYQIQGDLEDETEQVRDPHTDQVVLPGALVGQLMEYYHDHQAHPGPDRTLRTIMNRYWWESIRADVQTYCDSCQFCRFQKNHHHSARPTIQLYEAPSHPFEEIHMDLTEVTQSLRGNSMILVVKCSLTAAIELVAMKGKEADEVARAMVDRVYLRHGSPRIVYSDQGKEFCNKIMQQISAIYQMRHVRTTAGNPRSNGLVENHNRTLKDQLSVFTNARQDDWDDFLPVVQFSYMTTVSSRTGFTPFFMVYGREARQPSDIWISAFRSVTYLSTYVKDLVEVLHNTWMDEGRQKPKQVERMNKQYTSRQDFVEFEVGDRFYLRRRPTPSFRFYDNPNRRAKDAIKPSLQRRYTGPYVVSRKFSPVLYEAHIDGAYQAVHALKMQRDPLSPVFRQHIQEDEPTIPMEKPGYTSRVDRQGLPLIRTWAYRRRDQTNEQNSEDYEDNDD